MNILKRPIITEKSLKNVKEGVYIFEVAKTANKDQIKSEIEKMFGVSVIGVKTVTTKGKTKRAGKMRLASKKADWKKAIVKIKEGQKIDLFPVT